MLGLVLHGENLDMALGGGYGYWRRLSLAPFVKAMLLTSLLSMGCHEMVDADMIIDVLCRSGFSVKKLPPTHSFGLI